jgi:hypothetical protein
LTLEKQAASAKEFGIEILGKVIFLLCTWGLFCYLDTSCFWELTKLKELVLTCTANDQHFYCSCLWICFI